MAELSRPVKRAGHCIGGIAAVQRSMTGGLKSTLRPTGSPRSLHTQEPAVDRSIQLGILILTEMCTEVYLTFVGRRAWRTERPGGRFTSEACPFAPEV